MTSRRYNTSCEPCRKSRIGCDATLKNQSPCTNCLRRGKTCNTAVRKASPAVTPDFPSGTDSGHEDPSDDGPTLNSFAQHQAPTGPPSFSGSLSLFNADLESMARRRGQMIQLHNILWDTFVSIWDSRAALWMSSSCNPFLQDVAGHRYFMSRIVREADRSLEELMPNGSRRLMHSSDSSSLPNRRRDQDRLIDTALRHAVYAYACRWLPFRIAFQQIHHLTETGAKQLEEEVRAHFWRQARASIHAAMAQRSYRYILALFLFTSTEMPADDADFGFYHLCFEALFSILKYMRLPIHKQRYHPLSEYTTVVPFNDKAVSCESLSPESVADLGSKLDHLTDAMFWMGVIVDSTRSLVQQSSSVILPGRSGDGKVWDLIRQRNVIFGQSFKVLHASSLPLGQDVTDIVLQHALACKTMYFGVLNQFCDAAVHDKSQSVEDAAQRVLEESCRFHDTLDQLLNLCTRDYLSVKLATRLNYTLVLAHYQLGTLILADVLEALETIPEQLKDPRLSRLFACTAVVNAIGLALTSDRFSGHDSGYGSILLHDPTPATMIETLSRTSKAIFTLTDTGEIDSSTAQTMISVVGSALSILSRVSTTASFVLSWLRQKCAEAKMMYRQSGPIDACQDVSEDLDLLGICNVQFVDTFLHEMNSIDATSDQSLLHGSIAESEASMTVDGLTPLFSNNDILGDEDLPLEIQFVARSLWSGYPDSSI